MTYSTMGRARRLSRWNRLSRQLILRLVGETVLKGSWVMGAHVSDVETWDRIEKDDHPDPITGFSIGGSGERIAE